MAANGPSLEQARIECAVKHIGGAQVQELRRRPAEWYDHLPLAIGRQIQHIADRDVIDALAVAHRPCDHRDGVGTEYETHGFQRERRVQPVAAAYNHGNAPYHAIAVGQDGEKATGYSRLLQHLNVADRRLHPQEAHAVYVTLVVHG